MKTKLLAVLLAIGLITPSLHAQKALRVLKNARNTVRSFERGTYNIIKTPHIDIKPSLSTRVSAAVRGQTPALKRLQSIRKYQAYKGVVTQWRERNVSLAEELDFRGVIVTSLPNDGKMVDTFSADGKTWYAADDMLVNAVKDGRFVRFDETSGSAWFAPYKGGPEFEFYDEQLFKELDRSRELGIHIVPGEQAGSWHDWVGIMPKDIPNVKVFEGEPSLFVPGAQVTAVPWSNTVLSYGPGFSFETKAGSEINVEEIVRVNNWLAEYRVFGEKAASFNIGVVYAPGKGQILIQDSRGVLHDPKDLDAVIQAEKEIRQPGTPAKTSEIDTPADGGFEEVL